MRSIPHNRKYRSIRFRRAARAAIRLTALVWLLLAAGSAFAQGGPPYYTNDPGTPGNLDWEINFGYMPFYYTDHSLSHTSDVDINFGIGDRIQLTYETAWLRVQNPGSPVQFGLNQSNPGFKWRFYDAGGDRLAISTFPQLFLNNPGDAVRRGITPPNDSFLLPVEIAKGVGPVSVNLELGYDLVRKGPDGWISGLMVGHDFNSKFEMDAEIYSQGILRTGENQTTVDIGARYKLHPPVILLLMAGRAAAPASRDQPYFVGYFGVQFLLPPRPFSDE